MVLNKKTLKKTNHDQLIDLIKQSSILTMRTLPILKWKVKLIRTQENGFGFGIRGGKVRFNSKSRAPQDFDVLPVFILVADVLVFVHDLGAW